MSSVCMMKPPQSLITNRVWRAAAWGAPDNGGRPSSKVYTQWVRRTSVSGTCAWCLAEGGARVGLRGGALTWRGPCSRWGRPSDRENFLLARDAHPPPPLPD